MEDKLFDPPKPPRTRGTAALPSRVAPMLLRPEDFSLTSLEDATPLLGDQAGLLRRADELGYLFFEGLLPDPLIDPVRAFVREVCVGHGWCEPAAGNPPVLTAKPGARLQGKGWDDPRWVELQRMLRVAPHFRALAESDLILGTLEALYDEPAHVVTANYCWLKLPGSPEQTTRPHQDSFYLPDSPGLWTVWVPLVDTPFEVGPLGVVPGSHRDGLWPHVDAMTGIDVDPEVIWASNEVHTGDVVFFGPLTVHCAWSNISPWQVRASFDIRYEPRSAGTHTLLRPAPFEGSDLADGGGYLASLG